MYFILILVIMCGLHSKWCFYISVVRYLSSAENMSSGSLLYLWLAESLLAWIMKKNVSFIELKEDAKKSSYTNDQVIKRGGGA